MEKVRACESITISGGNQYDANVESPCGIAGSSGYGSAYFYAEVNVWVCVLDNNEVYIAFNGGEVVCKDPDLIKGSIWTLFFAHDNHAFSGKISDLDSWGTETFEVGYIQGVSQNAYYKFPEADRYSEGSEFLGGTSWHKTRRPITEWESSKTENAIYYYVALPIHNGIGNVNDLIIHGFKLTITNPKLVNLDYFPGSICAQQGSWANAVSCNRNGGFFRQKSGLIFKDRKNRSEDKNKSTVFIHDGTNFNTIAPKIGIE